MDNNVAPLLMPYDPDEFWERMRKIIREEIAKLKGQNSHLMADTRTYRKTSL